MSPRRPSLPVDLAMRIATEHLSYRSAIEEIEADLAHARGPQGTGLHALASLLGGFQTQVREHFALEERGGLFKAYQEHDDAARNAARTLLTQHRDFEARLAAAVGRLTGLERADDPAFAELERDLHALFQDLRRHEHAEDAWLERLVEQDIRRPS